ATISKVEWTIAPVDPMQQSEVRLSRRSVDDELVRCGQNRHPIRPICPEEAHVGLSGTEPDWRTTDRATCGPWLRPSREPRFVCGTHPSGSVRVPCSRLLRLLRSGSLDLSREVVDRPRQRRQTFRVLRNTIGQIFDPVVAVVERSGGTQEVIATVAAEGLLNA